MVPYIVIRGIEASIDRRFVSNDEMRRDETRCDAMISARERVWRGVCPPSGRTGREPRTGGPRVCASTARVDRARARRNGRRTSKSELWVTLGVGVEDGVKTRSSRASEDGDAFAKDVGASLRRKARTRVRGWERGERGAGTSELDQQSGDVGSDLQNAVGGAVGDGLNYLAGYDELEVTEGGEDVHTGEHTEDDAVDDRKAMWGQLKDMLGSDIMSMFSLPTFLMEPVSTLQKMAEIMQYQRLLEEANEEEDPDVRLAKVTAFAVAVYSTMERAKKPFNPILGETFELKMNDGSTYVAEQVSHHPPIGAGHVKTKSFVRHHQRRHDEIHGQLGRRVFRSVVRASPCTRLERPLTSFLRLLA